MNVRFKFRIYPTPEQAASMEKAFGCSRFIYNLMLRDKEKYFKETGKHLVCYPSQYKKLYPFLREVDSMVLVGSYNNLRASYNHYFKEEGCRTPKPKNRYTKHKSFTTYPSKIARSVYLEDGILRLPKIGKIKIVQHREIPADYQLKAVTVTLTPSGRYHASLLYEFDEEIPFVKPEKSIGLDYSVNKLYVTSEGGEADYEKQIFALKDELSKEYKKLKRCKRGSRNYEKQHKKMLRVVEKMTNRRKDRLHKLSKQLADNYDCVSVESLKMKEHQAQSHFAKKTKDNSYNQLVKNLEYKLKRQGKQLIRIDRWYPSSKACSVCGNVKEKLSMSRRVYKCDACGSIMDRDINAAINIKQEGDRLSVKSPPKKLSPHP